MRRLGYIASVLLLLASGGIGVAAWQRASDDVRGLRHALVRVLGPGEGTVRVRDAGTQTIFLERESMFRGKRYVTENVAGLEFEVEGPDGRSVEVEDASGSTTYDVGSRSGRSVAQFDAPEVGTYSIRTRADSADPFVIAVGRLGILSLVGTVLGGIALVGLTFVASIVIGVVTFVVDRQRRRADGYRAMDVG